MRLVRLHCRFARVCSLAHSLTYPASPMNLARSLPLAASAVLTVLCLPLYARMGRPASRPASATNRQLSRRVGKLGLLTVVAALLVEAPVPEHMRERVEACGVL